MNRAQLEADVCQSQAIEGIPYSVTSALSQAHLEAAQVTYNTAVSGKWPNVRALHGLMMKPSELAVSQIGAWRQVEVFVQGNQAGKKDRRYMPAACHVPQLMCDWEVGCVQLFERYQAGMLSRANLEAHADQMYYWYLCVHPFADGNGRTGRLMRNAMRIRLGLPWMTITTDIHILYVRNIIRFEDEVFCPRYTKVYT